MKNIAIVALAVVVVAVGVLVGAYMWFSRPMELPAIPPPIDPVSDISHAFPDRSSQVVLTAKLPIARIKELIATQIPKHVHESRDLPDQGGLSGIHIDADLDIDPISLTPEVNQASPAKVDCACSVHGSVAGKAFKWIIVNLLVGTLKTKSPDIHETVNLSAGIHGWVQPTLSADWNFAHAEHVEVDVKSAEIKIFGVISISVKDQLQGALNGAVPGLVTTALDAVRDHLNVRSTVEKAWNDLFVPVKISDHPSAYLIVNPQKVHLQQVVFDDPTNLTIRAALDAKIATVILDKAPDAAKPSPLPPLVVEGHLDPKFHVLAPIGLQVSATSPLIETQLTNKPMTVAEGAIITVRKLALYSSKSNLYLKAEVDASHPKFWRPVHGTIFLKCGLNYDAQQGKLRVTKVDFTAETRNTLANAAAWLLEPEICREIEKEVSIDMPETLDQLRDAANRKIASIEVGPGVKLGAHLTDVEFEGVKVMDDLVIIGFDISGVANCELNP